LGIQREDIVEDLLQLMEEGRDPLEGTCLEVEARPLGIDVVEEGRIQEGEDQIQEEEEEGNCHLEV
jgi:hypothetical protein